VIKFSMYVKILLKIVFSSTISLGLLAAAIILFVGETSMNFDIGLDIKRSYSAWALLGLPLVAVLVFAILSPASFLIYRLISR